jgi:hypothetical protein
MGPFLPAFSILEKLILPAFLPGDILTLVLYTVSIERLYQCGGTLVGAPAY